MIDRLLQEKPLSITTALQPSSSERELDRLNLISYADALKKFIQTCDTPLTVGLQGDWGSGKTSMMNMLRGDENHPNSGLLDRSKCLIVNFETWSYSQFNNSKTLPMACLYALTQKLGDALQAKSGSDKKIDTEDVKRVFGQATSRLANVLKQTKVGVAGISIPVGELVGIAAENDLSKQMLEFKLNFSELVAQWAEPSSAGGKRVVICIDDLDRIEPLIALEMLESIKNFLDVEGCVFVLAVDYEVVQEGMKKKLGMDVQKTSGKSFFDKIIQLPFNMPRDSYNIKNYIKELIKAANFPHANGLSEDKRLDYLREITLATVGGNPRSIKRVLNYARLLNLIRASNSSNDTTFGIDDSLILYSMICMQIAWPELFAHFMAEPSSETIQNMENWEYLERTPELQPLFNRAPNREKLMNDISTFVDTMFEQLDKDGDGQISDKEFETIEKVLRAAQFTAVEIKRRPRDIFVDTISRNATGENSAGLLKFVEEVFKKSKFYLNTDIKFRASGTRYVTLVYNRKQLGSVVSLKRNPFIIRLNANPHDLRTRLANLLPNIDGEEVVRFVRDLDGEERSLTGFGESIVNLENLMVMNPADGINILNAIVNAVESSLFETGRSIHLGSRPNGLGFDDKSEDQQKNHRP